MDGCAKGKLAYAARALSGPASTDHEDDDDLDDDDESPQVGAVSMSLADAEEIGDDDVSQSVVELALWPDVVQSVQVYQHCTPEAVGHGGGIHWLGISAQEIRSACALLKVKTADRLRVAKDVTYMGTVFASELNARARDAAARIRSRRQMKSAR